MATAKAQPVKAAAPTAKNVPAVAPKNAVGKTIDYGVDSNAGFENAGSSAFAIPFLQIIQSTSPQLLKGNAAYIKGAEAGMIFDNVTNELFDGDEGVPIIACSYGNVFIEWRLRENGGGGFVQQYDVVAGAALRQSCHRDDKNRDILPSGNQLVDHRNHYLMYQDSNGNWQRALLSLSSTAVKASKVFMSNLQRESMAAKAPMFALLFRMTTHPESNAKGNWHGPSFNYTGLVDAETYAQMRAFYEQVKSGGVKANYDAANASGAGAGDTGSVSDPGEM